MKKPLLWLLPPVGFACGWITGINEPISSREVVMSSTTSDRVEIGTPKMMEDPISQERGDDTEPPAVFEKIVPLVTLREVLAYPSEMHRVSAFLRLLDSLPHGQFANFHAGLRSLKTPMDISLEELFFRRWGQFAPQTAVEAAIADNQFRGQHAAFESWAERDAVAALSYAKKLPSLWRQTQGMLETMAFPKPGDLLPKDALRRIQELRCPGEPSPAVHNAVSAIIQDWARTDPDAAWREALALPIESNRYSLRKSTLNKLMESQVAIDPQVAAKLIEAIPEGSERVELQCMYVSALAEGKHRHVAKAYALGMPDGVERLKVINSLAGALLVADKEEAKALIASLPDSDWKDPSIFGNFFFGWIDMDPQSATEVLLTRIPADIQVTPEQQKGYDTMFVWWANNDPRAASEFLVKIPKNVRGRAFDTAVSGFIRRDSGGAAQWAASLPPGTDRDYVMERIGEGLARGGVIEVTNWLNQLPSDSGRSAAIEGFARAVISLSPSDALTWLRTVPGEADRLERLKRAWSGWKDREAAERWRDTSPELSAGERAVLR